MFIYTFPLYQPLLLIADVNECNSTTIDNPCQQICTNTFGSYGCSCNSGFKLQNLTECLGEKQRCNIIVFISRLIYCNVH